MSDLPTRRRHLTGRQIAAIVGAVILLLVLIALLNGNWSLVIDT